MIRKAVFPFLGIGLAVCMAGGICMAEDPEMIETVETPKPLKIGVINLGKIFDDYKKKMDQQVKLEKQRSEMQSELDKKEKELKKLEQELEVLSGDEKLKKKGEFDEKRKGYTAYYTVNNKELQRKQAELWKSIYNEIIDEIKLAGGKEGYDIVLKVDDGPVSGNSLEEIQLRVDIKKVLFHSPKVDFTDGIINILNEKYKRVKESKEKGT